MINKVKRETVHTKRLIAYYDKLYASFGPQGWWPGRTRFEVIIGAILTQNTSWSNVEKAIARLKEKGLLSPERLYMVPEKQLAGLIRPAGYFNVKARRIRNFLEHLFKANSGSIGRLLRKDPATLRTELLAINGIGPETADSIVLYAAGAPEFVVDAYTKRILSRHGLSSVDHGYDDVKRIFMEGLPAEAGLFNEFHALFVKTGKDFCKAKNPRCAECPLGEYL